MSDVLIFTPMYRLEPETVQAIAGQTRQGWHWVIGNDNPTPPQRDPRGVQNTLYQYNVGRDIFLSGDWQWWWIVESDIIPPENALERSLALADERNAALVRLPYLYRQPWPREVCAMGEHYRHDARNRGEPFKRPYPTGVTLVSGAGLGCALVRRDVVEQVPFRHGGTAHCDTYWNSDVWYAGFTHQYCDWSLWCGHKRPEGDIIWPKLD